jgi:dynein heavy chain
MLKADFLEGDGAAA